MLRMLLLLTAVMLAAGSASAQLAIVQQWPVDTFPGGIAYDVDRDHIWLVNDTTNELREYDRIGNFIQSFPGAQITTDLPIGIDYEEPSQHLWICDESTPEQVVECTKNAVLVSSFSVDAQVSDASGIAWVPADDNLYIADDNASEVVIFTKTGALVGRWSTAPNSDADAICYLDASGTLLVGDDNDAVVYEFTTTGTLLGSYDMTALLGIGGVEGLSYDPTNGNVFLSDSTFGAVIVYEISGFVPATAVDSATWGTIKAHFR